MIYCWYIYQLASHLLNSQKTWFESHLSGLSHLWTDYDINRLRFVRWWSIRENSLQLLRSEVPGSSAYFVRPNMVPVAAWSRSRWGDVAVELLCWGGFHRYNHGEFTSMSWDISPITMVIMASKAPWWTPYLKRCAHLPTNPVPKLVPWNAS